MQNISPIIIIGMHRSGTSIVARLLEDMGCFIGWRKPYHNETKFFIQSNDWLLQQSGASWDNPLAIKYLLGSIEVRQLAIEYLTMQLKSPRAVSYWGRHYLPFLMANTYPKVWGWKDPRNTFTLPIWLSIFPQAKIIHVVRHGVDVAQSLVVRQQEFLQQKKLLLDQYASIYAIRPKKTGFTDTIRGQTLDGAFSLWEEYVDQARSHVEQLGMRAIEVRYEDFLSSPLEGLANLARFGGITISHDRLRVLAASLKPSRGFAYRKSEELSKVAHEFEKSLVSRGYSA